MFWKKYFNLHKNKRFFGTWDYAWTFTNFKKKRLSIVPKKNLITNIGFDIKTGENPKKLKNLHKFNLNFPLIHPNIENRYTKYDDYCARNIYSLPKFIWRLKKKFSKLFISKRIIF